ncbi:trypsin-like serine protease [Geodermatophilus nigrescens]|uniref:Trypsin n=1 Tax=Geodermatophilus nigrescens TaxID=1070870 RepID=A0A1M5ETM5_9ACTN|nr:trypsin-like serine protease [Geodermatophilus nigrescens]SHF82557.1 Trypsin [Geodermatophilus nigrescens]
MRHRRLFLTTALAAAVVTATASPAGAITFGQPDGHRHPEVGALLVDVDPGSPGPEAICSGTLIAPTVFLTAAHCTVEAEAGGAPIWVTFASDYDEDTPDATGAIAGTAHSHPEFGAPGGGADAHDIAVVLLASAPAGITPAQLPEAGLLDELGQRALRSQTFTAVGYGAVREDKTGGPHGLLDPEGIRRFALQTGLSLQKTWFTLSMQPSTGDGGTCYGDSGGPHFLGGVTSHLLVSLTVTGDAMCRATDRTYRLDTASARAFLAEYVELP